jgi:peptidoglycan/xylan/chitin deacetylase (PgdA/CDA1 family)
MSFYWIKTHKIIKRLFPKLIWDIPNNEKIVYLTFDDGPTIEVTNWVLNQLGIYESKATFFCIGKNIKQNTEIFNRIISDGHSVGNHTFNHLNGWKTPTDRYIDNSKFEVQNSRLFRPPYGKIKPNQARELRNLGYKIIMWDVLSADFDEKITPEKCLNNVISNVESGSIIVFHDSIKAFRNLEYVLPKTLQFLKQNGFECQQIV